MIYYLLKKHIRCRRVRRLNKILRSPVHIPLDKLIFLIIKVMIIENLYE
jgi:hypothetical protein